MSSPKVYKRNGSGLGVDSRGGPVIDPTKNVESLVEAKGESAAKLREADIRYNDAIRAADNKRTDDLRAAEVRRIDDLRQAESTSNERLALAEAKRIDAIRAVDVNAVAVERQRSSDQASVLATQVAQSADTLRSLVATTAQAVATLQAAFDVRLKLVEQTQYEGKGKQAVTDPEIGRLADAVRDLTKTRDDTGGMKRGSRDATDSIRNAIMLLLALGAFFAGHFVFR